MHELCSHSASFSFVACSKQKIFLIGSFMLSPESTFQGTRCQIRTSNVVIRKPYKNCTALDFLICVFSNTYSLEKTAHQQTYLKWQRIQWLSYFTRLKHVLYGGFAFSKGPSFIIVPVLYGVHASCLLWYNKSNHMINKAIISVDSVGYVDK